ncbi:ABC transporter ATP-binding protein [Bradyrhizobium sp. JYMT SZCCT0428]|uniref:ABC transporter ATP-binding protein n=1 Tax=Bradyrhizobium sp. JYMT SZCCT0428 TaxID=2807673 RepID=UPI001BA6F9B6|nr:ABC transporter ATP-binding protein [Bradyrhizobium sp. JYMT SZCCT0428]MBR1156124.1 ABC transporter ATP-binding protein [Bradyrhizobium sp. JYMT SZCCT0428]
MRDVVVPVIAISCQGVSKSFALVDKGSAWRLAFGMGTDVPTFEALKDISFDVPKGQFVGILGKNGAGKSTLLRVVGGAYSADRGRVAINGALSAIYELGLVGNPQLTGRQYAERLLTVHGFKKSQRGPMIADIHDFSELGDRFEDPVLTYSAGMMARLFFSTATAGNYEVYLLDEILSVGDQHFQSKCWRRLRDRVSRGASGVLVTHDWSAIIKLCETAHIIDKGRVTYSGPPERAARLYLFGEVARQAMTSGYARFIEKPADIQIEAGRDLVIGARAEILKPVEVGAVFVIERLQPGYGWEIALMSRSVSPVGREPGIYHVNIAVPRLPLDPGTYQASLHLVMPDGELPTRRVLLDGFGWLDGNGITLNVLGDPDGGLMLPARWSVSAA